MEELNQYKLNKYQFNVLRNTIPNLHIYDKPYIGTEEIRQYVYCNRKIYFRYTLNAPMLQTVKMEDGAKKHETIQNIKNKADEEYIQKYYNIYLTDPELGLVGLIDYFEFDGKEAYPVEIKSGHIPPQGIDNPDKSQATAQAILIEKNFDFLVKKVRVHYIKFERIIDYFITIEDKLKVMEILKDINRIITSESVPEPTKDEKKCVDCECYKYCIRG